MSAVVERSALAVAVFVAGAVLLAVEIAASRVVAPYFGNSLYVWGALIGVVLTGLAAGYWLGGALADRFPSTGLLLAAMTLGAGLVLLIPVIDDDVLRWIVEWDPGARLNPLLAAFILFGPMSVVLAGVTPIAVRIRAHSVETVGRTAGRLFAISTLGSIAGTFATAFLLVPEFGTGQLLGQAAAALVLAVALVSAARRLVIPFTLALIAFAGAAAASVSLAQESGGTLSGVAAGNYSPVYRLRGAPEGSSPDFGVEGLKVLYRKETAYHSLAVVEDRRTRYLRFDTSYQSGMFIRRPFATRFTYTDYLLLGLAYRPTARRMLFIGLGGGSAPKRVWRDFRNIRVTVVEIDPVVATVASRYFALPSSPRLEVDVEDGRRYLQSHSDRWDVIAVDAYYSDSIPFHLTTREFLELVRTRLAPGGVVVSNLIGSLRGRDSQLFRAFHRTYRSVFPTVAVHPVLTRNDRRPEDLRNIILVAGESAAPERSFLVQRWRGLRERAPAAPDLTRAIRDRYEAFVPAADVPVLTDDYAPTDALLLN